MLTGDGLCQHVLSIALQQIILLQHATLTINRATQNEVAPLKSLPYFQGCQITFCKNTGHFVAQTNSPMPFTWLIAKRNIHTDHV